MSPFDLTGPEFLLFYSVFALVVLVGFHFLQRRLESGPLPPLGMNDPYLLACLNGGPVHSVAVSTLSLIDGGLLKVSESQAATAVEGRDPGAQIEIEKDVLAHFKKPRSLKSVFSSAAMSTARKYEEQLKACDLLPNEDIVAARRLQLLVVIILLAGVALLKISIALSRGHTNILFLIILAIMAGVVAFAIGSPARTSKGDDFLKSARAIFSDLRSRAQAIPRGGMTRELPWLAALFGVAAVPAANFPYALDLVPPPPAPVDRLMAGVSSGTRPWWRGGGSCGSFGGGCSSGSGSSCGGGGNSCGSGGGCGGGGGGCGGCGS